MRMKKATSNLVAFLQFPMRDASKLTAPPKQTSPSVRRQFRLHGALERLLGRFGELGAADEGERLFPLLFS